MAERLIVDQKGVSSNLTWHPFGKEACMTEQRAWPNAAMEARDRSAEEAAAIVRNLQPLIEGGSLHQR